MKVLMILTDPNGKLLSQQIIANVKGTPPRLLVDAMGKYFVMTQMDVDGSVHYEHADCVQI